MNYNELIQLYFERANAMQAYWNLYVIIVGGLLAFSSMRKQPAAVTTALVSILFALFAYKNLDAMHDVTAQRFATLQRGLHPNLIGFHDRGRPAFSGNGDLPFHMGGFTPRDWQMGRVGNSVARRTSELRPIVRGLNKLERGKEQQ